MAAHIYTGFWTDWGRGFVLGATVTLSARDGGVLLAFLAVFVTIIAIRLWRILSFASHQTLASNGLHDGLYYQRQFILRNASSPSDAIWGFLQQAWHWHRVADHALLRTIPWTAAAVLYLVLFAVASVLSSWISDGATEHRMVKSQACGFFVPANRDDFHVLRAHENYEAANYARQCYTEASTATSCDEILPVSSLSWTNSSVACPFEESVCLDVPAFQMATDLIDSHLHLGINAPEHNRIGLRRETVCSPLVTQPGYSEYVEGAEARALGWADGILIKYFYGARYLDGPRGPRIEHTQIHNNLSWHASIAYNVWSYTYSRNEEVVWEPVDALKLDNRDITLLLVVPNSVVHLEPNTDPVFSATVEYPSEDGSMRYLPTRYVSPIAYDHKGLFSNAEAPELELNNIQRATMLRIAFIMSTNNFYSIIFTRTQSFLRGQERVASLTQLPLLSNQWQVEMGALFSDTLSLLQHQIMAYPTGPPAPGNISVVTPWSDGGNITFVGQDYPDEIGSKLEAMCHSQRVRFTQGTLNFSVLGLGILLGVGSLIVVFSYLIEPIVSLVQRRTGRGAHAARRWTRDESLQMMRILFEGLGAGEWEGTVGAFPRTKTTQWFEYDEPGSEESVPANDHVVPVSEESVPDSGQGVSVSEESVPVSDQGVTVSDESVTVSAKPEVPVTGP